MSQQINLFNPIFLKQKKVFTAVPMAEALGVIMLGAVLLTWYASHSVDALEARAAAGKAVVAEREHRLAEANKQFAPRPKSAALAAELARLDADRTALYRVETVIAEGKLGNASGYAEYFRALARQNLNGLWLTGVAIAGAGTDIAVQGNALQPTLIPQYIARLTGEPVMRGKSFARLEIARPDSEQGASAGSAGSDPVAAATAAPVGAPAAQTAQAVAPYVRFSLHSVPAGAQP